MYDLVQSQIIKKNIKTREEACKEWYERYKEQIALDPQNYKSFLDLYIHISDEKKKKIGVKVVNQSCENYILHDPHDNRDEERIFTDAEEAYMAWYEMYIEGEQEYNQYRIQDFPSYQAYHSWFVEKFSGEDCSYAVSKC